jgi:YggT family protein
VSGVLLAASVRESIGDYVAALFFVYTALIFAYIIVGLVLSFGARLPYNRGINAVLEFLRDVCDPYLRIFRKFVPMVGPLDLSPILAILLLQIVGSLVVALIRG